MSHQNCTPPAIDNYPNGLLSQSQLLSGGFLGPLSLAFYSISGITVICDEYFVPSLEFLREKFKIRAHIAGATIMAMGTSAPEFFTNVMGTFIAKDNLGIGTILGSALFNIFIVLAAIGITYKLSNRYSLQLQFYSFTRDIVVYGVSILSLVIVMSDGIITVGESLLLVSIYVIYMIILAFDQKISRIFSQVPPMNILSEEGKLIHLAIEDDLGFEEEPPLRYPWSGICSQQRGFFNTVQRIKLLPLRLLFFFTIPNQERASPYWKKWVCPLTFLFSLIYMSIFTYILTWMTTTLTYISGIPDSVAGLTFLSAGTSIPELVSSVILIKSETLGGTGGAMAASNLIGSNTFDILICLGIPWLISSGLQGKIETSSQGLGLSASILLLSLILLYVILYGNGFYLSKVVIFTCFLIYVFILTLAILYESNVFYLVNLPLCESVL